MKTKLKYVSYLSVVALLFTGCSKDNNDENAVIGLENTTWVATMIDDNPRTSTFGDGMTGVDIYFPWLDCHMDDSFIFSKDRLSINDNGTACDQGLHVLFGTKNPPYSYDAGTKILTVGVGDDVAVLDVYELNGKSLKLGLPMSQGRNLIFLLKRK